jgi:putative membrane protein
MLASAVTLIVAAAHVLFMVLESVLWTKPTGRRIFGQTVEDAEKTRVLAFNQGIYNGGLAALLAWGVFDHQHTMVVALLVYVFAMGIVGGATAKRTILLYQALPAAIALALQLSTP